MNTSVTDLVRDLEAERDGLAQRVAELTERCVAQELVIARIRSLRTALDEYAAEHGDRASEDAAPPTRAQASMPERAPKAAESGSPHARRYTDADAREWLAELRAGQSCADLWRERHVAIDTVQRWINRLLPDATFDSGRLVEAGTLRPTSARPDTFGDVQGLEAGELLRAGHSPEAVAAAFGVDVLHMRARLRRLEMDPDTGKFLNRPPEEELLRDPAAGQNDDEEAA